MNIQTLQAAIAPLRHELLNHPVYEQLASPAALRQFMQLHVFAVWDFMSLLKKLQQGLTCLKTPWLPPADPVAARMINQIVLGEESDTDPDGSPASHFDVYLQAMKEVGADTSVIETLISQLRQGTPLPQAMQAAGVPEAAQAFISTTFQIIHEDHLPAIASAFTLGREDLIPGLFRGIVGQLNADGAIHASRFIYYLDRHIGLDEEEHGPLAFQILDRLCGTSPENWLKAESAAQRSLQARLNLWNAIQTAVQKS